MSAIWQNKTTAGTGRVVPLNQRAFAALTFWARQLTNRNLTLRLPLHSAPGRNPNDCSSDNDREDCRIDDWHDGEAGYGHFGIEDLREAVEAISSTFVEGRVIETGSLQFSLHSASSSGAFRSN